MNTLSAVEYIWLDGALPHPRIRSKSRVMNLPQAPALKALMPWRFNGAYTLQASDGDSDCLLKPVRIYQDPFRGAGHYMFLCEVHDSGGNTHESNRRAQLRAMIKALGDDIDPWLGCKQPYTLCSESEVHTFADISHGATHYCSVGCDNIFGRDIAEAHAELCMTAGILLTSWNAGTVRGQWEFSVGYRGIDEACDALVVADDVWLARYLLHRVGEQFGVQVSFSSQHQDGEQNIQKLHTGFSTAFTRNPRCGLTAIQALMSTLESSDDVPAANENFRVPPHVKKRGYGYIEDRSSLADADPYQIGLELIYAIFGKACNLPRPLAVGSVEPV